MKGEEKTREEKRKEEKGSEAKRKGKRCVLSIN